MRYFVITIAVGLIEAGIVVFYQDSNSTPNPSVKIIKEQLFKLEKTSVEELQTEQHQAKAAIPKIIEEKETKSTSSKVQHMDKKFYSEPKDKEWSERTEAELSEKISEVLNEETNDLIQDIIEEKISRVDDLQDKLEATGIKLENLKLDAASLKAISI